MPAMLHKRLRILHADLPAALRAESLHRLDVFIHAVMRPQPVALRRMAHEHLDLAIDLLGHIDIRRRRDQLARVRIARFDRIAIV